MGIVLIAGLGGLLFNFLTKPHVTKIAETQAVDTTIPGWWLKQYFGASVCDKDLCKPSQDPDNDKLTNAQEFYYHTDPLNAYTVKDPLNDGQLVAQGFDPSRPGHMSFDDVASEENIIGESLVYEDDIKQLIAQTQDINKVNIPLVADTDLKIDYSNTTESFHNYLSDLQMKVNKYFSPADAAAYTANLQSDTGSVDGLISKAGLLASDLKTMTVPMKFLSFHKDYIALYQLMPDVLAGQVSPDDGWFDKAEAFLAVQQKLNFEKALLDKQFNP